MVPTDRRVEFLWICWVTCYWMYWIKNTVPNNSHNSNVIPWNKNSKKINQNKNSKKIKKFETLHYYVFFMYHLTNTSFELWAFCWCNCLPMFTMTWMHELFYIVLKWQHWMRQWYILLQRRTWWTWILRISVKRKKKRKNLKFNSE